MAFSQEAKQKAIRDKNTMPKVIFDELMIANGPNMRGPELPNVRAEKRKINRVRVKHLPKEPKEDELHFLIPEEFQKGFFRESVSVGNSARHIIMATDVLSYLMICVRWYLDGTFFLVDTPFHQLFTINGF